MIQKKLFSALNPLVSGRCFYGLIPETNSTYPVIVYQFPAISPNSALEDADLDDLLGNPDIIRNKMKIYATRANAQAILAVQKQFGSFNDYIWSFVDFKTIDNQITNYKEAPTKTELSETMSKALKKQGFKFVGPVCVYSFLEAAGLINDHENNCDWK